MNRDILSMNITELRDCMAAYNQPLYRADQIFEWLHHRGAAFFDDMDNLPKNLRETLAAAFFITPIREIEKQTSRDGTVKYLFALGKDEICIETVLMKYKHGYSVCISTQAGCRMGCTFCASTAGGLVRNLTPGEMCAQVYNKPKRVSSVVLMGCGEPLDNFDAVLRFIELLTHKKGANIGARHITLSTCGLVPQIKQLADKNLQINLAVSLHGATDDIRKQLMPIANRYPIKELLEACRYYINKTNRRITFEYTLIPGLNDSPIMARDLAGLLKGLLCHVNIIPVNDKSVFSYTEEKPSFTPGTRKVMETFSAILTQHSITTTLRRSLGSDICAACGQLRAGHLHTPPTTQIP
jgi:23S rRNA (adenine2503-C2)-methyltransferase